MELSGLPKLDKDIMILCPGKNLSKYCPEVIKFIQDKQLITFGVNRIGHLYVPQYHVYTNTQRFRKYGGEISRTTCLMLGRYIPKPLIKKFHFDNCVTIHYNDRDPEEKMKYENGFIYGYYRSVTCLTIMIAHILNKHATIYIAGMDGFTYYQNDDNTHYYEDNQDEKVNKEQLIWYDNTAKKVLNDLKEYGIKFHAITPTIHSDHYLNVF